MTKIQRAVGRLIKQYGSLRKAQAATGINYAYLQRLSTGERMNPSAEILAILGIEKRIDYVRKTNG